WMPTNKKTRAKSTPHPTPHPPPPGGPPPPPGAARPKLITNDAVFPMSPRIPKTTQMIPATLTPGGNGTSCRDGASSESSYASDRGIGTPRSGHGPTDSSGLTNADQ